MKTGNAYWSSIGGSVRTLAQGLGLTFLHVLKALKKRQQPAITNPHYFKHQEGIATVQFPHVTIPVPDTGRYRLHNEIEDCIVCDKCAKVCPVDCITIEPIRSPEEFGKTSDGTSKRIYAAVFDINMGQCCFCGLCTTVCPTECLTMTKTYDFSTDNMKSHTFSFSNMGESEKDEKRLLWENFQLAKTRSATKTDPDTTESKRTES